MKQIDDQSDYKAYPSGNAHHPYQSIRDLIPSRAANESFNQDSSIITIPRLDFFSLIEMEYVHVNDFSKTVDNMDGAVGAENTDQDSRY